MFGADWEKWENALRIAEQESGDVARFREVRARRVARDHCQSFATAVSDGPHGFVANAAWIDVAT